MKTYALLILAMCIGCADPGVTSVRQAVCNPDINNCCGSPIVVDVVGDGIRLTSPEEGVGFSLRPGQHKRYSWTEAGSDDAWLVMDRDGDGEIRDGSELFGNFTPQESINGEAKNGFVALRALDTNKDGQVSAEDADWSGLRLWTDRNHDGLSQLEELSAPNEVGIEGFSINYITTNWKAQANIDEYGNLFAFESSVYSTSISVVGRRAWDIYLASGPLSEPARFASDDASYIIPPPADQTQWRCNAEMRWHATGSTSICKMVEQVGSGGTKVAACTGMCTNLDSYTGLWTVCGASGGIPFDPHPNAATDNCTEPGCATKCECQCTAPVTGGQCG